MKTTEILVQLDKAADEVSKARDALSRNRLLMEKTSGRLAAIPNKYADLLAAVNDENYGTTELEVINKQKLDAIASDFTALRAEVEATLTWMSDNVTEY